MTTGTLIITETERAALREAMVRAREHPVSLIDTMRAIEAVNQVTPHLTLDDRKAPPPPRHTEQVLLPFGYRVAISWEEQPSGMCLHMSMSTASAGKIPRPEAVAMVLEALGIKQGDFPGRAWIEEFEPGQHAANVIVVMEPRTVQ